MALKVLDMVLSSTEYRKLLIEIWTPTHLWAQFKFPNVSVCQKDIWSKHTIFESKLLCAKKCIWLQQKAKYLGRKRKFIWSRTWLQYVTPSGNMAKECSQILKKLINGTLFLYSTYITGECVFDFVAHGITGSGRWGRWAWRGRCSNWLRGFVQLLLVQLWER